MSFITPVYLQPAICMPDLFDLPQAGSKVDDWDLSFELNHGDRIGLFGLDMPVLSM